MTRILYFLAVICIVFLFPGCEVIGGIFKAGVWVGILVVVGIIALILWLVNRGRSR